ncbi:MAG TPA: glycosidase [Clostridiales bacterium]|nr:glycosidase [Clostridiales bacterium]
MRASQQPANGITTSNPIGIKHIGDPFVLHDQDGMFYLYATSSRSGFKVWSSSNLKDWTEHPNCYVATENSFGYKDFWAPEVIYYKGQYVMHYSARWKHNDSLRMGVAIAQSPAGPFIDVRDEPMMDLGYAVIDGHIFIDDDDNKYFYYSRDCSENIVEGRHESHIYVALLNESLDRIISEPILLTKPEKPFEILSGPDWLWNEGPFVMKRNGLHYLMYSANCYSTKEYCICYGTSKKPTGPFVKGEDNPILKYKESQVSGPGHNSVFKIGNNFVCAYHVHTDYNHPSGDRQVFFDKLYFDGDKLKIDGPTVGKMITWT